MLKHNSHINAIVNYKYITGFYLSKIKKLLTSKKTIFKDTVNSPKTIPPAYFLPFSISTAIVGDSNFIHLDIGYSGNFGRYLGFKTKPILT